MTLIEAIEKIQKDYNLNNRQLADILGCSESIISLIKAGKRNVGLGLALALYRNFPELHDLLFPIKKGRKNEPKNPSK